MTYSIRPTTAVVARHVYVLGTSTLRRSRASWRAHGPTQPTVSGKREPARTLSACVGNSLGNSDDPIRRCCRQPRMRPPRKRERRGGAQGTLLNDHTEIVFLGTTTLRDAWAQARIIFTTGLLASVLTACGESPRAWGEVNSIIVGASEEQWAAIGTMVESALETRFLTVRPEKTFPRHTPGA